MINQDDKFPTVSYIQPFLDIVGGQLWCIHQFLASLLTEAEADWVGLIDLSGARPLIKYECGPPAKRQAAAKLLDDVGFAKLLRDEPEPDRVNWYLYGPKGKVVNIMAVGVWHHEGEPDQLRPSRLVLVSPRVLSRSPLIDNVDSTFEVPALAASWFFWASYHRERLQKLCDDLRRKRRVTDGDRKELLASIVWPMPFKSIVKIVEAGGTSGIVEAGSASGNKLPWPKEVRRRIHFEVEHTSCPLVPPAPSVPCLGEREKALRQRFGHLARLIEWRSTKVLGEVASPREPDDKDYQTLSDVTGLFQPVVDLERLNGKSLAAWFGDRFWNEWAASGYRIQQLKSNSLGPAEKLRHFSSCSRLAHYVLTDMPADDQAIEALVWAVSRYGHDRLGIDPRIDLRAHLLHAARNEPALHVLKPFYRDHFFHAIEVCFLGHLLLDTNVKEGLPLHSLVGRLLGLTGREHVLREWYVAALLHDIGYSVEVLKSTRKMLAFCKRSKKITQLGKSIDEAIQSLSRQLVVGGPCSPDSAAPDLDHGIVGAEHLRSLLEAIAQRNGGGHMYEAACRAVALHNLHGETVEFRRDPLAFLLILCDAIQEWNRPHLRFASAPAGILTALMNGAPLGEGADLTGPLEEVSLNIGRSATGSLELLDPTILRFNMSYGDEINQNAGVFNLWINTSSNLQRLRLDGLPFNIVASFRTPAFKMGSEKQEYQMHRLRCAAEETHMTFLARWFPCGVDDRAVRYEIGKDYEILTLDLAHLSAEPRITESVDTFRERLALWRNYNEDREFAGDYAPAIP
jgi:hypothetical protein